MATESYELRITGFTSKSQVETFISWYSEQGEQDGAIWFEENCDDAKAIFVSSKAFPIKWEENTAILPIYIISE